MQLAKLRKSIRVWMCTAPGAVQLFKRHTVPIRGFIQQSLRILGKRFRRVENWPTHRSCPRVLNRRDKRLVIKSMTGLRHTPFNSYQLPGINKSMPNLATMPLLPENLCQNSTARYYSGHPDLTARKISRFTDFPVRHLFVGVEPYTNVGRSC